MFEDDPFKHTRFSEIFYCEIMKRTAKDMKMKTSIFRLVVTVWMWIVRDFMEIPSMTLIWLILEGKMQIFLSLE